MRADSLAKKERPERPEPNLKNMLIVGLTIAVILLLLFVGIRGVNPCTRDFPPEANSWCAEEGTYYIAALDEILMDGEGYVETYKQIALITIDSTYNATDPPVEVFGNMVFWAGYEWDDEPMFLQFPLEYLGEGFAPVIPCTYNDYGVTEDLLFESLLNAVEYSEGDYEVLNFSISSVERYVTMTVECHESLPFYNTTSEFITEGYFYGVEYELEAYLDYNSTATIYLEIQVVSECNSGIPLFQSYIFATWMDGYGWIATSIFSLKTIATSVALIEV